MRPPRRLPASEAHIKGQLEKIAILEEVVARGKSFSGLAMKSKARGRLLKVKERLRVKSIFEAGGERIVKRRVALAQLVENGKTKAKNQLPMFNPQKYLELVDAILANHKNEQEVIKAIFKVLGITKKTVRAVRVNAPRLGGNVGEFDPETKVISLNKDCKIGLADLVNGDWTYRSANAIYALLHESFHAMSGALSTAVEWQPAIDNGKWSRVSGVVYSSIEEGPVDWMAKRVVRVLEKKWSRHFLEFWLWRV